MDIIKVNQVSRVYTSSNRAKQKQVVRAVDGIDFSVNRGEIFGILGPNGAGKSTTIKMLTTLLLPSSGDIKVNNYDTFKNRKKIREVINVVFGGERGLYWKLSGYENLLYFAKLYKIPSKLAHERIIKLMDDFGLTEFKDLPVAKYSSGMKQKLHFVRALINDPEIIFLDEPTNAMDPKTALQVRQIIMDLKKRGKTIILATHNMLEADKLCDRLIIMNKGKIIKMGTPMDLKKYLQTERIEIILNGLHDETAFNFINTDAYTVVVSHKDSKTILEISGENLHLNTILNQLLLKAYEIYGISERVPELEEVYLKSVDQEVI